MRARIRLTVLGSLALCDERGAQLLPAGSKPLIVVAYLAMERRPIPRDHLAQLVWPDRELARARSSLRNALSKIGSAVPDELVERTGNLLRIREEVLDVDWWDSERAIGDNNKALPLMDGPFLQNVNTLGPELDQWRDTWDRRTRAYRSEWLLCAFEDAGQTGDWAAASAVARTLVEDNPLLADNVYRLAHALSLDGRQQQAIAEIEGLRERLKVEFGDDLPEPLFQLHRELLNGTTPLRKPGIPGPKQTTRRSALWQIFAAVTVATAIVWGVFLFQPVDYGTLSIPVVVGSGPSRHTATAVVSTGGIEVVIDSLAPAGAVAIGTPGLLAFQINVPDGVDIGLVRADGVVDTILSDRADEVPLEWSPDGELLLYSTGQWLDGARYKARLAVWHRNGSSTFIALPDGYTIPHKNNARWSPDGTRIATPARKASLEPGLLILTPGRVDHRFFPVQSGGFGAPAWSPDGNRIVFSIGGETPGLMIAFVETGVVTAIPKIVTFGGTAAWLSRRHLLIWGKAGSNHVNVVDVETHESHALEIPDFLTVRSADLVPLGEDRLADFLASASRRGGAIVPTEHSVWPDSVSMAPPVDVYVGEHFYIPTVFLDSAGLPMMEGLFDLTWSASPPERIRNFGNGLFRALQTGAVDLTAELGITSTSRAQVTVNPVESLDAPLVFGERWTADWPARWIAFGEPLPRIDAGVRDPDGSRTFLNSGDQNHRSGAVTRQSFDISAGLTLEVLGQAPITAPIFQALDIGLVTRRPEPGAHVFSLDHGVDVWATISDDGGKNQLGGSMNAHIPAHIPLPDSVHEWIRYVIQLKANGTAGFYVNGELYLRRRFDSIASAPGVFIYVGGASVGTDMRHGSVRVYRGLRFAM